MSSRVRQMVDGRCSTVTLTGAGVSAESGVPTFRGAGGMWEGSRPEDLATPEAFRRDPAKVWSWYDWRRGLVARCRPNGAHQALARLEAALPWFRLITQNVDGLHGAAGSREVIELHGNLWKLRCMSDGRVHEDRSVPLPEIPPRCPCGEPLRPDVVWFGEALREEDLAAAFAAAQQAELFLVVGTSGVVHPAARLPGLARRSGAHVVEINAEETPLTALAHESHRGPAAELLPRLLGMEPAP